jgi:hypothetical protein
MRDRKPIPKNTSEILQSQIEPYSVNGKPISDTVFSQNRGTDYSMKGDTVKDISIGLEDIDGAVMYYFNNVIKPTVIQDNNRMAVRTIYGNPERWKSIQADGFYRDGNGHVTLPLIVFKRDSVEKDRSLANKLDGNKVHNYQVVGSKYNKRNAYDKFDLINNRIPSEQYYITSVPDYITVNYSCIIFTNFVEQNNKIVEAIEFASDAYWGDPKRFQFRAKIDSFSTTVVIENGADRIAKTTFNIIMNGYIIPDTVNKELATTRSKFYTKSQVVFDMEVIDAAGVVSNVERLKFANKAPLANSAGSTSFIGGGINVHNNTYISPDLNIAEVAYLNTNVLKTANTVTTSTAVFTGAVILQPPAGSSLPPTSNDNFTFFVNGVNVASSLVTITEGGGDVTLLFNTAGMGYTLISTDEVIAVGKFQ